MGQIEGLVDNTEERHDLVERCQEISGVGGVLHNVPFRAQILSPWCILLLLLIQMLRMNCFIATIRPQYLYMLGLECNARAINHFFDAALPTAGIISTARLALKNFSIIVILTALTLHCLY